MTEYILAFRYPFPPVPTPLTLAFPTSLPSHFAVTRGSLTCQLPGVTCQHRRLSEVYTSPLSPYLLTQSALLSSTVSTKLVPPTRYNIYNMKYSKEMEIASRKRAISESSVDVEDESSGSDFAASNPKPTNKRQRTRAKAPTTVETPTNKPVNIFARKNGKIWQSSVGHLVGSPDWKKEIFARDEVWAEIKKLPKKILSARLAVNIVTELEPNINEKPKAQPRNTSAITNGSVRKPTVFKAASDIIDLSDHEQEPEVDIREVITEPNQVDARVPDSTRQSQQLMFDHWAASHQSMTVREATTNQSKSGSPPAPAGLIVNQANAAEDTRDDKRAENVEQDVATPASVGIQANAESQADDAAQGNGESENAGELKVSSMILHADKSVNGATAGSNEVPEDGPMKGRWEPTRF